MALQCNEISEPGLIEITRQSHHTMQALIEDPPILPVQLLRRQVYQALVEHGPEGEIIEAVVPDDARQPESVASEKTRALPNKPRVGLSLV